MKVISIFRNAVTVVLSVVAALALLLCLSYPDSVIPPDPAKEYMGEWTLYALRSYVWVLPLTAGAFVCALSSHFFRVWFAGMLTVGLAGLWAWPVLRATYPEFINSELPWQSGGMLTLGLLRFGIILFGGFLLMLLCRFLFTEPKLDETGTESASVIDPAEAKTVQQIAAAPLPPKPKFRFGEADQTLITRFGKIWRALMLRSWLSRVLLLGGVLLSVVWVLFYPQPTEEQAMERDKARMREYVLRKTDMFATRGAVHAALRVMQHISDEESLAGMTREEAEAWLELGKAEPHYRAQIRDSSDIAIPSVNNAFESRERFLTLRDVFGHWAVLYIRTGADGKRINVAEVQDAGWNAVIDEHRRRLGNDFGSNLYH